MLTYIAKADMRSYVWTDEYTITEPGKTDIEHHLTISIPKLSEIKGKATIEHEFEIEIGITNHFDLTIFHNFQQRTDGNLYYTNFDFRSCFLIGEKNQFFLDPLIYLEYGSNFNLSKHKFEGELVLAKDIGRFNFSINPIFQVQVEDETEFTYAYAIGFRYEFNQLFRLGMEFVGDKDAHYAGLVVSHGQENLWVAASPTLMFSKNTAGKPELLIRMILGIGI